MKRLINIIIIITLAMPSVIASLATEGGGAKQSQHTEIACLAARPLASSLSLLAMTMGEPSALRPMAMAIEKDGCLFFELDDSEHIWGRNYYDFIRKMDAFIESLPIKLSDDYDYIKGELWLGNQELFGYIIREMLKNAYDAVLSFYDPNLRIKSKRPDKYKGRISISIMVKENTIELTVSDNGAGQYSAITLRKEALRELDECYYLGVDGKGLDNIDYITSLTGAEFELSLANRDKYVESELTVAKLTIPLKCLTVKQAQLNQTNSLSVRRQLVKGQIRVISAAAIESAA